MDEVQPTPVTQSQRKPSSLVYLGSLGMYVSFVGVLINGINFVNRSNELSRDDIPGRAQIAQIDEHIGHYEDTQQLASVTLTQSTGQDSPTELLIEMPDESRIIRQTSYSGNQMFSALPGETTVTDIPVVAMVTLTPDNWEGFFKSKLNSLQEERDGVAEEIPVQRASLMAERDEAGKWALRSLLPVIPSALTFALGIRRSH